MKYLWTGLIVLVMGGAIAACGGPANDSSTSTTEPVAQAPASPVASPSPTPSVELGTFAFDEIYDIGAAGCGMTLWTAEENAKPPAERQFLLLSGLDDNSTLMKINGQVVRFQRIASSGEPFYGQFTSQTFRNEEQSMTITVDVTVGQKGEIESVAIPSGTLGIEAPDGRMEIPVIGDAGC